MAAIGSMPEIFGSPVNEDGSRPDDYWQNNIQAIRGVALRPGSKIYFFEIFFSSKMVILVINSTKKIRKTFSIQFLSAKMNTFWTNKSGLMLIAFGNGIKSCVSPLGGDQFEPSDQVSLKIFSTFPIGWWHCLIRIHFETLLTFFKTTIKSYFAMFYFSTNVGAFVTQESWKNDHLRFH